MAQGDVVSHWRYGGSVRDVVAHGDVVAHLEKWWLDGSAPDFWGRGPGFEFGISHNNPDALQDHCIENLRMRGKPTP